MCEWTLPVVAVSNTKSAFCLKITVYDGHQAASNLNIEEPFCVPCDWFRLATNIIEYRIACLSSFEQILSTTNFRRPSYIQPVLPRYFLCRHFRTSWLTNNNFVYITKFFIPTLSFYYLVSFSNSAAIKFPNVWNHEHRSRSIIFTEQEILKFLNGFYSSRNMATYRYRSKSLQN